MPEGVEFPFPSLLFHEGRTYGQPEVVLISLPQVETGLRSRLPGSFRRRAFARATSQADMLACPFGDCRDNQQICLLVHADLLMPQEALLRRGRSGRYHSLLGEMLPAGNQCRVRQKGGNGSWRSFIIR